MFPELFRIGNFALRSYGLLLAIAFLTATILAIRRAKKLGVDGKIIENLSTIVIIASIVGSRLFYVIFHIEEFRGHWLDIISPYQSDGSCGLAGLSMMGGVVLAIFACLVYIARKQLNFYKLADIVAPAMALGFGIARIGCFLNGCCFGRPICPNLGMVFPPNSPAGATFTGIAICPTQLFHSFSNLLIFGILLAVERKVKVTKGSLFGLFLALYAVQRVIVDHFRYYEPNAIVFKIGASHFTYSGLLAVILGIAGLILIFTGADENNKG